MVDHGVRSVPAPHRTTPRPAPTRCLSNRRTPSCFTSAKLTPVRCPALRTLHAPKSISGAGGEPACTFANRFFRQSESAPTLVQEETHEACHLSPNRLEASPHQAVTGVSLARMRIQKNHSANRDNHQSCAIRPAPRAFAPSCCIAATRNKRCVNPSQVIKSASNNIIHEGSG
ncbi:hypothetical protein BN2476_90063 [Paraburkholderia piptadeniae]|uniref:Uncharacterized protein n=1 Tax=Paraburkholderia piptadeniae TaxID=1701573 RepID=A0A1N7RMS1_9BURK|nr:hypothetical protein BN2476_90063 [Paraburkholderia piptadeniae]